ERDVFDEGDGVGALIVGGGRDGSADVEGEGLPCAVVGDGDIDGLAGVDGACDRGVPAGVGAGVAIAGEVDGAGGVNGQGVAGGGRADGVKGVEARLRGGEGVVDIGP